MFCAFVLYMLIFSTSLCSHLWHSHNLLLANVTRTLFNCTFIQNCSNALFMLLHIHCFHYNAFSFTNHFRSLRLCLSSQLHLFVATVVQLQYSYIWLSVYPLGEEFLSHAQYRISFVYIEVLLFPLCCCCNYVFLCLDLERVDCYFHDYQLNSVPNIHREGGGPFLIVFY